VPVLRFCLSMSEESDKSSSLCCVILAAGLGTRMKSDLPKVLHPLCGLPLLEHVLRAVGDAGCARTVVVVSPQAQLAIAGLVGERAAIAVQPQALGTAHALRCAHDLAVGATDVLVASGDTPLVRAETLRALVTARRQIGAAVALLTFYAEQPAGLGRILRDPHSGEVEAIIEEVDCTPEQAQIHEVNAGTYCFDGSWLWSALEQVQPNSRKGEYFLTDLIALVRQQHRTVHALLTRDPEEGLGVNTRVDLARAEAALRRRINERHMLNGVTLVDPDTTYISPEVQIGADTVILPGTHLQGKTRIGRKCEIGPNTLIVDSVIGDRVRITYSVIRDSQMDDDSDAGPFAHIRANARIGAHVHIGNFAEVKNSALGAGTKMGHFSYLGDATVGAQVNIGAGTITCNYDGKDKHPTRIGEGAFIGSDTMLVAPVEVGAGAKTGAGAVVTRDVPPRTLVVGVPARVVRALDDAEQA
ncbi:MAG: bifunctional UDP-N-acetylglucosamine diphosphorylase/glucosamine-1-phosphate N-acetyltransferase GlmU, partial [Thermoflexales bacterium]|nr:bifunctional UDP-N-acetylglucosamine diphosphorylase/glucosamine-1-phosphate N-acetyltransferase GlmU [Thermoflexales bacterium]